MWQNQSSRLPEKGPAIYVRTSDTKSLILFSLKTFHLKLKKSSFNYKNMQNSRDKKSKDYITSNFKFWVRKHNGIFLFSNPALKKD